MQRDHPSLGEMVLLGRNTYFTVHIVDMKEALSGLSNRMANHAHIGCSVQPRRSHLKPTVWIAMNKSIFYQMPEELRCKATELSQLRFYLSGYAWDRENVLTVFEWARQRGLAILGGDVYPPLQNPEDIYYPGFWMERSNIQEDWDLFVELSYQNAVSFVQNTPYLAQSGLIIEPSIVDEQDYLHLDTSFQRSPTNVSYWNSRNESDLNIERKVTELNDVLLNLRNTIRRHFNGHMPFFNIIEIAKAINFVPETDQNMVYAERLRRELLEYALGTLLGLTSEGTEDHKKQTLEHLLRYLNGEEPFLGEKICS